MTLAALRLAALLLAASAGAGRAEPATIGLDGAQLLYDDAVWRREETGPPLAAGLLCIAASCPRGLRIAVVTDPRPLPAAGAAAFGPGAVSALLVEGRVQSLTPGMRLRPRSAVEPYRAGAFAGYRVTYDAENRDLEIRGLTAVLLRVGAGTLLVRAESSSRETPPGPILDDLLLGLEAMRR